MPVDAALIAVRNLVVSADHGQIYVWAYHPSPPAGWDDDEHDDEHDDAVEQTAEDAWESGRFVSAHRALLNVFTPGQRNLHTPMRLEVWSAEPADDLDRWDHEADLDFDVPEGRLDIAGPPAHLAVEMVTTRIPPGRYRVRVSGRGFTAVGAAGANGDDSYRLRFWPRQQDTAAGLRRRWPGWEPSLRHWRAGRARIRAARPRDGSGHDMRRPPRPQPIITAVVTDGEATGVDHGGP